PKPWSTASHVQELNPQLENHENESHAIKQQTYSNRLPVPQSSEAFHVHLRGRDFASYGKLSLGCRLPLDQSCLRHSRTGPSHRSQFGKPVWPHSLEHGKLLGIR